MSRTWIVVPALLFTAACGSHTPVTPTPVANAPQIACPADMTLRGITGASQAVTYSAPAVTGGTSPVNTSCTQASGASFSLGTTSVSCTASDAMARQAACSFSVTLTGQSISVTKYDAVGDSFTAGENGLPSLIDVPNAYPTRLQAALEAMYPGQGVAVVNRGTNGEFVEETALRIRGYIASDRPGAVLLLSGYNDLLNGGCDFADGPSNPACPHTIEQVAIGIRDCIRHSKEAPQSIPYVFVSTLTPPGPVLPGAAHDRRISSDAIVQANTRIRQTVAAEGATLVDPYPLFAGHEAEYVDTDGLHLRPAGYQVLADTFFSAITGKIPQTPLFSITGSR
jgi:lysophospholipase L1-like esterase